MPKPKEFYPGIEIASREIPETPVDMAEEMESGDEMKELRVKYHEAIIALGDALEEIIKGIQGLDETREKMAMDDVTLLVLQARTAIMSAGDLKRSRIKVSQEIGKIFYVDINQDLVEDRETIQAPEDMEYEVHLRAYLELPGVSVEKIDIFLLKDGSAVAALSKAYVGEGPELTPLSPVLQEASRRAEPMRMVTEELVLRRTINRFLEKEKSGHKGIYMGPKFDFTGSPGAKGGNAMLSFILTAESTMDSKKKKMEYEKYKHLPRDVEWETFRAHVKEIQNPTL